MSRPASKWPKSRLNLDLMQVTRDKIEKLMERTQADSLTEVIRRAIECYEVIVIATRVNRGKIIIRKQDGSEEKLVIL